MMTRRKLIKTVVFSGGIAVGGGSAVLGDEIWKETIGDKYISFESLRKDISFASKWWKIEFRKQVFAICLQTFPSLGESRESVHVWKQYDKEDDFRLVWSFRTLGAGSFDVIIDKDKGTISLKGTSNTEFKDVVFAFVNLGATIG